MSLVQIEMIKTVKALADRDERISAVLMYGSFIKDEGDCFSDIEFYLFYREDFDHQAWITDIHPVQIYFTNEFGTEVAIFDNLIRGEFHFHSIDDIDMIQAWEGLTTFEYADRMRLVDKHGRLAEILASIDKTRPRHDKPEYLDWLAKSLINNLLMTVNIFRRGEMAHAQQAFQYIHKYLLWMIRLAEGADNHWESPTKRLEQEISPSSYIEYVACVPRLKEKNLSSCLDAALDLTGKLFSVLEISKEPAGMLEAIREIKAKSFEFPQNAESIKRKAL